MARAIAFLPWVSIGEPTEVGPMRLLPYEQGQLPGDLENATQPDIDGVLNSYESHRGQRIRSATILEVNGWKTGMEIDDEAGFELFRARELLAFAALSKRKLFGGHFDYCNNDTFELIVQRYLPGKTEHCAFTTRRRDGGTLQGWSHDSFRFFCPNHVSPLSKPNLDLKLLDALLSKSKEDERLLELIREFNWANTDSQNIPEHVEIVMLKTAFEWLLKASFRNGDLVKGLEKILTGIPAVIGLNGPLKDVWTKRWPDNKRRPLFIWAQEFCAVRGASAHAASRKNCKFVWSTKAHLAFASMLFPLLLKKKLADDGLFTLDDLDYDRLRCIDGYILHDPFATDRALLKDSTAKKSCGVHFKHPWLEMDFWVESERLSRMLRQQSLEIISDLTEQFESDDR